MGQSAYRRGGDYMKKEWQTKTFLRPFIAPALFIRPVLLSETSDHLSPHASLVAKSRFAVQDPLVPRTVESTILDPGGRRFYEGDPPKSRRAVAKFFGYSPHASPSSSRRCRIVWSGGQPFFPNLLKRTMRKPRKFLLIRRDRRNYPLGLKAVALSLAFARQIH
jgi:hypothetical protein